LAGNDPTLDTTNPENDPDMKKAAGEIKLHTMAKVRYILEMRQSSELLRATQKQSRAHTMQMTAEEYISDMQEIAKASWSLFHHDSVAAFKLSERSPLPPALFAKDLPGGQSQILNDCRIRHINRHPVEWDEVSEPESISDTKNSLTQNGYLDYANDSEDDCPADGASDID